jgi:hypothetical protein
MTAWVVRKLSVIGYPHHMEICIWLLLYRFQINCLFWEYTAQHLYTRRRKYLKYHPICTSFQSKIQNIGHSILRKLSHCSRLFYGVYFICFLYCYFLLYALRRNHFSTFPLSPFLYFPFHQLVPIFWSEFIAEIQNKFGEMTIWRDLWYVLI